MPTLPTYSKAMEKKYGKAVATKLADPSNYMTRSQADAMGLGSERGIQRAPDGGAIADYSKGWRFLQWSSVYMTPEELEIMKKHPKVADALKKLHNMGADTNAPHGFEGRVWARMSDVQKAPYVMREAKYRKIIEDYYSSLILAPKIKVEKEQKEREEDQQRLTIATLKMRVQELTKKPIDVPTAPAVILSTDRSWSKYAILGIGVVIFLIILRRRA